MSEPVTLELNDTQRDLILQGLRYVRSSRRFEFRATAAPPDEQREHDLRVIAELMGYLDPSLASAPAAKV
ncbi:MAG: hypothetical protein ACKV0T_05805 [Planctomycetales bacterium]